jgi:hypothetical protein
MLGMNEINERLPSLQPLSPPSVRLRHRLHLRFPFPPGVLLRAASFSAGDLRHPPRRRLAFFRIAASCSHRQSALPLAQGRRARAAVLVMEGARAPRCSLAFLAAQRQLAPDALVLRGLRTALDAGAARKEPREPVHAAAAFVGRHESGGVSERRRTMPRVMYRHAADVLFGFI